MMFQRPPKPDVFEVLMAARTRVFIRCAPGEYLMVSALRHDISLIRFCDSTSEPLRIEYVGATADQLQLFDGKAWNLSALLKWLKSREEE
jgi:hypothetical protein